MAVPAKRVEGRGACILSVFKLAAGQEGVPVAVPGGGDRTVHAHGTWGGASLGVRGSLSGLVRSNGVKFEMSEDTTQVTNFFDLTDARQNVIAMTSDDGAAITEAVYWIKPVVTGGDGTTDLTVVIMHRGT